MNPSTATTTTPSAKGGAGPVYRIPPHHYIHVLDQNTNVSRLEIGPKTFIKQDNETVTIGPEKMITVPYVNYLLRKNRKNYSKFYLDHVIIVLLNHP
jgi:major vault protein